MSDQQRPDVFAFLTKPHTAFVGEKAVVPPEEFRDGAGGETRETESV